MYRYLGLQQLLRSDAVLRGLPPNIAIPFLDDVAIPTAGTLDDHLRDVGMVFDRLIESGLSVKASKVYIAMTEVPYLGFLVGRWGTRPSPAKTAALLDMVCEDMRYEPAAASRYAGMLGFYQRFLPDIHTVLAPFHELKGKGSSATDIMSSLRFKASFAASKYALVTVTALARPNEALPYYIDVDAASSTGLGAVLSQRQDPNDPESHLPLAFWSRRFQDEEHRYGVRDQECLRKTVLSDCKT